MFWKKNNDLRDVVTEVLRQLTIDTENKFDAMHKKFRTVEELEKNISDLKIEKSVREEEFARKEREITHKLGLEKMRQEQEAEMFKRELAVKTREEHISAEEKRFKEQIEFERKHLEKQIVSLNVLVEKVFEKLPQVTHEIKTINRLSGKVPDRGTE